LVVSLLRRSHVGVCGPSAGGGAQSHQQQRRFEVRFDPPVPPGTTVTTVLKPWSNPDQADTYMFEVTAWPAGPNPTPSPLGYATLRIYNRFF
jgi:hypothetical protein